MIIAQIANMATPMIARMPSLRAFIFPSNAPQSPIVQSKKPRGGFGGLTIGSGRDQLAAASRIIQGIVTGIGFVGAGVIVQGERGHKVHGLTTAATVWISAVAGILRLGAWRLT